MFAAREIDRRARHKLPAGVVQAVARFARDGASRHASILRVR